MANQKIFFSYAWGDAREQGESREKIVNDLYESLQKAGYNLVRDKVDLGYKGIISDFMKEIGKGSRVIIVVSDKYVRSPFCMFELYEVARNCNFDKAIFSEKVFPIMFEFIDFARPKIIDEYFDFWAESQKEWEDLFKKRMGQLSSEQFSRYEKVKVIGQNIGKLMDWLTDMNTLNLDMLSKNDFAEIKKALGQPEKETKTNDKVENQPTESPKMNVNAQEIVEIIKDGRYEAAFEKAKNIRFEDEDHNEERDNLVSTFNRLKKQRLEMTTEQLNIEQRKLANMLRDLLKNAKTVSTPNDEKPSNPESEKPSTSPLDTFKKECIDLIDELDYSTLFEKIKKSGFQYTKPMLAQFSQEFQSGSKDYSFPSRLKTFVNSIKA